jgi:hypothetical protein
VIRGDRAMRDLSVNKLWRQPIAEQRIAKKKAL